MSGQTLLISKKYCADTCTAKENEIRIAPESREKCLGFEVTLRVETFQMYTVMNFELSTHIHGGRKANNSLGHYILVGLGSENILKIYFLQTMFCQPGKGLYQGGKHVRDARRVKALPVGGPQKLTHFRWI